MASYILTVVSASERKVVGLEFPESEAELIRLADQYQQECAEGHVVLTHPSREQLAQKASRELADISREARLQCALMAITHPTLRA